MPNQIKKDYTAGKQLDPQKLEDGKESFPSTPTDTGINTMYRFDFQQLSRELKALHQMESTDVCDSCPYP